MSRRRTPLVIGLLLFAVLGGVLVWLLLLTALASDREGRPLGAMGATAEAHQDARRVGPRVRIYWLEGYNVKFAATHVVRGTAKFEAVEQEIDGGIGHSLVAVVTDFKPPLDDPSCCISGALVGTWYRPRGEVVRAYLSVDGKVPNLRAIITASLQPVSR